MSDLPTAVLGIPILFVLIGVFEVFSTWTNQSYFYDLFYVQRKMRWMGPEGARRYYMMVGMVRIVVGGGLLFWWLWMTGSAWLAAGPKRAEAAAKEEARTARLEEVIADDKLDQKAKVKAILECCAVTGFKGMKIERMGSSSELVLGCTTPRPGKQHFADSGRLIVPLSKVGINALVLRCRKQSGSIEFYKFSLEGRQVGDVLSAEEVEAAYTSR